LTLHPQPFTLEQELRAFSQRLGLDATQPPVGADFSEQSSTLRELVRQCASGDDEAVTPPAALLTSTLMAYKRVILWDILLGAPQLTARDLNAEVAAVAA